MAFLVVLRHTELWCKTTIEPIICIATPTFFCITGYFLFSASKERELAKATRWAKKGLYLCIGINLLYLLYFTWYYYARYNWHYEPLKIWTDVPMGDTLVGNFILNIFTGISYSYHLWYLSAFWIAMLIFYPLRRFAPALIYITPLLYAWTNVCVQWGGDIFPGITEHELFLLRRNGLFKALPFICTGYLLAKHSKALLRIPLIPLWFICGGVFLYYGGTWLSQLNITTYGWHYYTTVYLMVVLTLLLCMRFSKAHIPFINGIGQHHSANIYYTHILIYFYLQNNVEVFKDWEDWAAVIVYFASIPMSYAIILVVLGWKKLKECLQKLPMFADK